MNFINKLNNFMYSRYGRDELYNFLFYIWIIFFAVSLFVDNKVVDIFQIIIIVIMFYRFFSKNIKRRRKENNCYLKIKRWLLRPFNNIRRNISDRDHIYKKCPRCKTVLRLPLPSERGFKKAKCPHCHKKVLILALKKQKIEVIKK